MRTGEGRGIYSVAMFHVAADAISFAATFFQKSPLAHFVAAPLQTGPAALGSGLVLGGSLRDVLKTVHPFHVGASVISLAPTFFQKSERAHFAAPPFQIEPAALGLDLVLGADLIAVHLYCCDSSKEGQPKRLSFFSLFIPKSGSTLRLFICSGKINSPSARVLGHWFITLVRCKSTAFSVQATGFTNDKNGIKIPLNEPLPANRQFSAPLGVSLYDVFLMLIQAFQVIGSPSWA